MRRPSARPSTDATSGIAMSAVPSSPATSRELSLDESHAPAAPNAVVGVVAERAGVDRRQQVVARELLAHVEHVAAHGARGAARASCKRRDQTGAASPRSRATRHRLPIVVARAASRLNDLGSSSDSVPRNAVNDFVFESRNVGTSPRTLQLPTRPASCASPARVRASRDRSPESCRRRRSCRPLRASRARSMRQRQQLRLPGAGLQHEQLLRRYRRSAETPRARATTRPPRPAGVDASRAGRLIGAVGRSLDQAEFLDVARQRGLGHVEAHRHQTLPQLFLAVHGLVLDQLANGRQPPRLHKYAFC